MNPTIRQLLIGLGIGAVIGGICNAFNANHWTTLAIAFGAGLITAVRT